MKKEYPPSNHDIYETDAAYGLWKKYREAAPYPDGRGGRTWKPFHKLDPEKLQYIVGEKESVIIRDSKTKEIVCMVVWNASGNTGQVLNWANEVIRTNVDVRKSVRVSPSPECCFGIQVIAV